MAIATRQGSMRVLVVDDEVDLLLLYRVSLECEGHEVVVAASGPAGLDAAVGGDFDLVLLDMMLPGLDGFGVLAELTSDPTKREPAVLIASARTSVDDQIRGLQAGAVAYLTKPFPLDVLRSLASSIGAADADGRRRLRSDALTRLGLDEGSSSSEHATN